jgi:hypothetical protein
VVQLVLGGRLLSLSLGSGHEQVPISLLVPLLLGVVGGAFVGNLVPLCLASGAVENRSDHLLT